MFPKKIYIITTKNDDTSKKYYEFCHKTCNEKSILPIEVIEWTDDIEEAWDKIKKIKIKDHGKFLKYNGERNTKAECVTLCHFYLWNKIIKNNECAVIFEHDAVLLKDPVLLDVPNNIIVGLGYKTDKPDLYEDENISFPQEIVFVKQILGAHAYAINSYTAKKLLDDIINNGVRGWIDCTHFQGGSPLEGVMLGMASPPPAIGWVRDSTIWLEATKRNGKMIRSFIDNLYSPGKEKIKNIISKDHFYK